MFTARFDDPALFFDFLATHGTYERFHLKYPNGDPPESWSIYALARSTGGLWVASCDYPLIDDDRWPEETSVRLGGWST